MDQTPQEQEYLRCCARNFERLRRDNVSARKQQPEIRHGNINASEAASVLYKTWESMSEYFRSEGLGESSADGSSCNPFVGYKKYIHRKINWNNTHRLSYDNTDRDVHWGKRFEPVAIRIFQSMEGKTVESFGTRIHPKYRWACAKPDGIVYDFPGRPEVELLEVKCPCRCRISEIVPIYYWIQAQFQMEVFNIGVTNFFQCKFRTFRTEKEFMDEKIELGQDKGVCIQFGVDDVTLSPEGMTIQEAVEWAKGEIEAQHPDERLKIIYWKVERAELTVIKRDSQWFEKNKHFFYRAHLDIQGYPSDYPCDPSLPAMPILSSFRTTEPTTIQNYIDIQEDICGESADEIYLASSLK